MKRLSNGDACRWFRSNLSEVVSREATAEVQAEADAHRDLCSDCESEYLLAFRIENGFGNLPELDPGGSAGLQVERIFSTAAASENLRVALPLPYDPTQPVELGLSCQEFKDMLGDFVSEELPVGTMLDGVEHATVCRSCGDDLSALQTMQDSFRKLAEVDAPESIFASLMARIDAEEAAAARSEPESVTVKKPATARAKLLPVLG